MDLQYLHCWLLHGSGVCHSQIRMLTSSAFAGAWAHPRCNRWDHVTQQIAQEMSGDVRRCQESRGESPYQVSGRGTHVPAWLTNHVCPFSGLLISIEFLNFAIFSCYNCFTRLSHWFAEWLCFPSFQLRGLLTFLEPFLRNSTNWGVSVWTHSETGRWNKSLEAWKNVDTTTSHDNSNLERLTFMLWCSCILHLGISMLKLTPAPYSLHNTTTSGSQILQGCSICTCCIMLQHFIEMK